MSKLEISKKGKAAVPAFPLATFIPPDGLRTQAQFCLNSGMDLRDYFAAAALPYAIKDFDIAETSAIAEWSYSLADAMLNAREK